MTEDNIETWNGLSDEEKRRMGMVVDAPKPKTATDIARAMGVTEEEAAIYGSIRNRDDFERASREIKRLSALGTV